MSNSDTSTGFMSGLIVGALIGAVIALLYAPQSGEETRRVVREKAGVAKDAVMKAAAKARDTVNEKIRPQSDS